MHAFLITGQDKNSIDIKIDEIVQKGNFRKLEFVIQKIDDIRELEKFVKLSLEKPTAIIIRETEKATTETLNAFLKNLEEPQKKLIYILTATNIYSVLPTIVSRCQIIKTTSNNSENSDVGKQFINSKLAEKISLIDQTKKREEAVSLIKEVIIYSHQELSKSDKKLYYAKVLKLANSTLNNLNANGNVNLQLSVFAFKLTELD